VSRIGGRWWSQRRCVVVAVAVRGKMRRRMVEVGRVSIVQD